MSNEQGPGRTRHLFEGNVSLHPNKKYVLHQKKGKGNRKSVRFWANNRASVARQGLKSISCPKLTDPSFLIQVGHFDPDPNSQICSKTSINDLTKITGEKQTQRAALLSTGYMGRFLLKQLPDWMLHRHLFHKVFEYHKFHTAVYFIYIYEIYFVCTFEYIFVVVYYVNIFNQKKKKPLLIHHLFFISLAF